MSKVDTRLGHLKTLADMLSQAALRPVAEVRARRDAVKARIDQIAAHRRALLSVGTDPILAAQMLAQAAHLRRLQMSETEALARAEADLGRAREAARRAYGREQILAEIEKQQIDERRRALERKRCRGI
ncbi:hypothetical protein N0B44_26850 [Roseibacterium beibuensis]|uniref:Flagellar FliJ protein n=1 Tax=[Roseibacterium] beibuensis TaxID=1193142 RepID=A0ABP9LFC1_9RHOB|nr:hypothetical protein [Roseibacterium beibuensis]MCS6626546.1 hypothetical protein [Roseibacterium beibuensis]